MADNIQTMIPRYGELNRIYRDYMDNSTFSFDRQKFISDFCQQYNDMKSFEAAILELVLDRQKEQYTLILNSLKTEIEKSIQAYETRPISNSAIERVCHQHMERYSLEIEAQLDVTRSLNKPLTGMIPLATGNILPKRKNRQKKNMNAARLNMTGKKPD
jgi:hypothetical protein